MTKSQAEAIARAVHALIVAQDYLKRGTYGVVHDEATAQSAVYACHDDLVSALENIK